MRQFIRHPADIPIEVRARGQLTHAIHNTSNLGIGGLAFRCDRVFEPGEVVEIRISLVRPSFEVEARMVEQVCHIENYKKEVCRDEGRILSSSEAAMEWINKYASGFSDPEA